MITLRQFSSFQAFVDFAETPHPNDALLPCVTEETNEHYRKFTGVSTKEEAFFLCRTGFPKGTEAMRQVLETLKSQITLPCEQFQFVPSIEGSAPDVQAYIQGIPEDMLFMEPISMDAPPSQLSIQMELFYSWQIGTETARMAGAVIFAAQEALKMQGCNIDLTLSWTYQGKGDSKYQTSFPLNSNIDLDTFAFIYTHPAMLRRIVWSVGEKENKALRYNFGFHSAGNYGLVSNHSLNLDATLSFQQIAEQCTSMDAARIVFQKLVDSKFNSTKANQ